MTEKELLSNYPLLADKDFNLTRTSIIALFNKDNLADDRGYLIDYCDTQSNNDDDLFFYKMLPNVMYILKENETAYTTPDQIICLNYPMEMVPMDKNKFRRWYFVFCHECMHQLWDTFGVGDEIKQKTGKLNFRLLNIASDCVINDYLDKIRPNGKLRPVGGIFPDVIEKETGVKYDRNTDTQYSLYLKLAEIADQKQKELQKLGGDDQNHADPFDNQQQGNQQNNQQNNDNQSAAAAQAAADKAKEAAEKARRAADEAQKAADKGDDKLAKDAAADAADAAADAADATKDSCPDASKDAQDAANDANDTANDKNSSAQEAADAAKAAADAAEQAAAEAQQKANEAKQGENSKGGSDDGQSGQGDGKGGQSGQGKDGKSGQGKDGQSGDGKGGQSGQGKDGQSGDGKDNQDKGDGKNAGTDVGDLFTREMIQQAKERAKKVLNEFKDHLSGPLGEYIQKCKSSKKIEPHGLMQNKANKGGEWKGQVLDICTSYLRHKLNKIHKYKRSFDKFRKDERPFTSADFGKRIVNPRRKKINTKIGFDISLYIDTSSSMSSVIDKVFDAAYDIADSLKTVAGRSQVVDKSKISLRAFIFTQAMREIKYNEHYPARGGTYDFDKLISDIHKNGAESFINIVVTDGQFLSIKHNEIIAALKNMEGMLVLVTNEPNDEFKSLQNDITKELGKKFVYIEADPNFTVK